MRRTRSATLLDVAERAGVGKTTAANALTGTGRMADSTRALVIAAARDLGYRANRSARQLRTGATGTIGIYLPQTPTSSDYYMRFVFGALECATQHDVDVTVIGRPSGSDRDRIPDLDGVIVCDPMIGDTFAARLIASPMPTVTCERALAGDPPDGTVWSDHAAAVATLLDQMHAAGARRPALLAPAADGDWARQLGEAYRRWCRTHRCPSRVGRIGWVPTAEELDTTASRLLDRDPAIDALLCGPVDSAAMVLPALRRRGLDVGGGFLLACATDSPAAAFGSPSITAIEQFPREAGERCAELLLGIARGEVARGTTVQLPVRLHVRASTAGRPG